MDETAVDQSDNNTAKLEIKSRPLVSGALPAEIRALLDEWYAQNGRQRPPPCAISDQRTRAVYTSDAGAPARYEHKDGEKLEVMLYTLPELEQVFNEKYVIVVQGPTQGPFIIGFLRRVKRPRNTVPYFIWEGSSSSDVHGWEQDPSIRKLMSPQADIETISRDGPGGTENEAIDHPSDSEHFENDIKLESVTHPDQADEDDWEQSPLPEEPLTAIPSPIRISLNEWYSHKGSKEPPPCAVEKDKTKYFSISKAGNHCTFTHRNGERMAVSVFILPEFANSTVKKRYVIIAKGQTVGPVIIGFVGDRGIGMPMPYHVWEGLGAQDTNGWEATSSIKKALTKSRGASRTIVADAAISGDDTVDDSDGVSIDYSSRSHLQPYSHSGPAKIVDQSSQGSTHVEEQDRITDDNPMPVSIKAIINEWGERLGSSFKLESLPCATGTPWSTLKRTSGGRPVVWQHANGEPVTVTMYPLRGTTLKDGHGRSKVIVAESPTLGLFLIGFSQAGTKNGKMAPYKIWAGVRGGRDGFETGAPAVSKIFSRRESKPGKLSRLQKVESEQPAMISDPTSRKRKREDETPFQDHRSTPSKSRPSLLAVSSHIHNNVVFLFYSVTSPVPRVRLFGACDSIYKLFAQAVAGDVFEDNDGHGAKAGGVRVLSLRFGEARTGKGNARDILVVEDDEEDFDSLLESIKAKDWWTTGRTAADVEGSGTIEVRAKV